MRARVQKKKKRLTKLRERNVASPGVCAEEVKQDSPKKEFGGGYGQFLRVMKIMINQESVTQIDLVPISIRKVSTVFLNQG